MLSLLVPYDRALASKRGERRAPRASASLFSLSSHLPPCVTPVGRATTQPCSGAPNRQ